MATALFLGLAFVPLVVSSPPYSNNYDQLLHFQCPTGQSIKTITSQHHNRYEDRQYGFDCQPTPNLGVCRWSGYVNNFDQEIFYQCPGNSVMTGVVSYHHNHYEDRRFKFYCCSLTGGKLLTSCSMSSYVNDWDRPFTFRVGGGRVLRGANSFHDNRKEDRRWRFETCSIQ